MVLIADVASAQTSVPLATIFRGILLFADVTLWLPRLMAASAPATEMSRKTLDFIQGRALY